MKFLRYSPPTVMIWILLPVFVMMLLDPTPVHQTVRQALASAKDAKQKKESEVRIDSLLQVLDIEPWRVLLWEELGGLQFEQGKWREAIDTYQSAKYYGAISNSASENLAKAFELAGENEKDLALDSWQNLANKNEAPSVLRHTAQLYRKQKELDKAVKSLQGAINQSSTEFPESLYDLCVILAVISPEEALRLLLDDRVPTGHPYHERLLFLTDALRQVSFENNLAYQNIQLGRALGKLDEWDLAEMLFEKASQIDPSYAEAWAFLGEARQHGGKNGLKDLQYAAELKPDSTVVQSLLALYWRRNNRFDLALEHLFKAAAIEPNQGVWQIEIGNTFAESGNLVKAMEYYQDAVKLEHNNPVYWRLLAIFCIENNLDMQAIGLPAARQALVLTPNDAYTLDTMGSALQDVGDYNTAERFFVRALEQNPDLASAHLHLGELYFQINQREKAFVHFSQASHLFSEDSQVNQKAYRFLNQYFGMIDHQ